MHTIFCFLAYRKSPFRSRCLPVVWQCHTTQSTSSALGAVKLEGVNNTFSISMGSCSATATIWKDAFCFTETLSSSFTREIQDHNYLSNRPAGCIEPDHHQWSWNPRSNNTRTWDDLTKTHTMQREKNGSRAGSAKTGVPSRLASYSTYIIDPYCHLDAENKAPQNARYGRGAPCIL